jgi:hypothetical protein
VFFQAAFGTRASFHRLPRMHHSSPCNITSSSARALAKVAHVRRLQSYAHALLYLRSRRAFVHVCVCFVVLNEAPSLKFRRHTAFVSPSSVYNRCLQ